MTTKTVKSTVLITGASSGIGRELVPLFAADSHSLVLVARRAAMLEEIAAEIRNRFKIDIDVIGFDLAEPDAVESIRDELNRRNLQIDILVNNAGFGCYGSFAGSDINTEERMIQVNIIALTALTKLFLPGMIARGSGRILNMGSTASFVPVPMQSVYGATKAYVLSFTEALAEELRGTGVSVTAFCPGATATGFAKFAGIADTKLFRSGVMSAADVARIGYRALMRGQRIVVAGGSNQALMLLTRFVPRSAVVRMTRQAMMKTQDLKTSPNGS